MKVLSWLGKKFNQGLDICCEHPKTVVLLLVGGAVGGAVAVAISKSGADIFDIILKEKPQQMIEDITLNDWTPEEWEKVVDLINNSSKR